MRDDEPPPPADEPPPLPRPWWGEFVVAGTSAVLAICFTNPVDVVKTRMQVQGPSGAIRHPVQGLALVARTEGLRGLQRGLGPSCLWQFSNVSVRFGVYGAAKRYTGTDAAESGLGKWLRSLGMAGVSGGLAAVASNPFFILKTRFQSGSHSAESTVASTFAAIYRADGLRGAECTHTHTTLSHTHARTHAHTQHAACHCRMPSHGGAPSLTTLSRHAGLFRGLSAFAPRVIVASAVQLSTYDAVKEALLRRTALSDGATYLLTYLLIMTHFLLTYRLTYVFRARSARLVFLRHRRRRRRRHAALRLRRHQPRQLPHHRRGGRRRRGRRSGSR